jgi:hypothetical protein
LSIDNLLALEGLFSELDALDSLSLRAFGLRRKNLTTIAATG